LPGVKVVGLGLTKSASSISQVMQQTKRISAKSEKEGNPSKQIVYMYGE